MSDITIGSEKNGINFYKVFCFYCKKYTGHIVRDDLILGFIMNTKCPNCDAVTIGEITWEFDSLGEKSG